MKINSNNYYSTEANEEYFSVSQYKDFEKCPAMAMAKINDEWEQKKTESLLVGSYLDELLTGTEESLSEFIKSTPELFTQKGTLRSQYLSANNVVNAIYNQPLMMKYLNGKHQVIMTGEIAGVPIKIKMDSYKENEFIADLKYMKTLRSPNLFEPMITYWGYDIQASVYQEIVRQNTGKVLPFYFIVATKENPPHLDVGIINNFDLMEKLEEIKQNISYFADIKKGILPAKRCEEYNCNYCTETRIIKNPVDVINFGIKREEIS